MTEFHSTHDLIFEAGQWNTPNGRLMNSTEVPPWLAFRVGTCHGLWRATDTAYEILSINNEEPGNGHLKDVLEWFESSCIRDKKDLLIKEFFLNNSFKMHLINKRGFWPVNIDDVIKYFA